MTSCSSQRRPNPARLPIHGLFPQQYRVVSRTVLQADRLIGSAVQLVSCWNASDLAYSVVRHRHSRNSRGLSFDQVFAIALDRKTLHFGTDLKFSGCT